MKLNDRTPKRQSQRARVKLITTKETNNRAKNMNRTEQRERAYLEKEDDKENSLRFQLYCHCMHSNH